MQRILSAALAALALASAGCQFPRDPEGTLSEVEKRGVVKVGVSDAEPFVDLSGSEPDGVEVELIEKFARERGWRVEWVQGSESELTELLEGTQIQVMLAGLERHSPLQRKVAFTRPYANVEIVLAVPPDADSPDIEGLDVKVERDSPAAAILEKEFDADPVEVDSLEGVRGEPVAVEDYLLDDLGYRKTGHSLKETEHCMAVPFGENAWLVELEKFLLDHEELAAKLLREESEL